MEVRPLIKREVAQAFVAFLLVAWVTLGVNPFRGQIIGPFDLLVSQPAWGSKVGFDHVRNAERSDVLDYYLPRWIQARNEIRGGDSPCGTRCPREGSPGYSTSRRAS